ncbi:PREDICTED: dynein-1-beta heavy chain, flagellar inner arm I1 complex [Habropoda laboriosa]|uniref:dynein-1-beta heavy chain, flagellar inner arm I1 complex n=1 Tax=Habropoda laboriosa TaxID=597456 RepID=UPI00083D71B2|nr:PREDICTED: dynein-1-beta heavy chain, flagellar inner arm I1 complex [Habropoda laboriosa]
MSGKKEQKPEGSKKADKMVDYHREFLDMDTDEEDFGRQESPEVEEELPLEPEKPVYSEEELITLVKHVKDLTHYFFCDYLNWNECCDEIIREYFKSPSNIVLSIFYEKNELNAILNIPVQSSEGFTYFLRSPWQIYTPDNFRNTVSFGSVNKNVKNTVFKFMENIYAPIVLHSDDYASFVRNDVFVNLHEFMMRLMEEIYKPMDLTALYVPKERLLQTFSKASDKNDYFLLGENETTLFSEEDERKRKLVDRLEKIILFWIRQLRRATIISTRKMLVTNTNLKHLRTQLLNAEVRSIIDILKTLHSPSANTLGELTLRIDARLKEASSNLTSNMETLCQAMSSQIMHQCIKYIELDVVLGNNPEMGIQMLEKCIFCCNIYKTIYDNLTVNVISYIKPDKKWNVNEQEVFNKIDTFKQRCYDVIEICKALIVFGRGNKIGLIGGPKGTDYEAYWREIESLFHESLDEIIMSGDIIFDVTKSIWLRKIRRFRYAVLQLENMVVNLINDIFENVKNIEEGIEAIYALQKFEKRKNLRDLLQNKWIQVWKIFSDEIESCYMNAIYEPKKKTDIEINLSCISQYLRNQYSIIINALDWIGVCGTEKCVLQQYEHVLDVIDKRRKMFNIYSTSGTE